MKKVFTCIGLSSVLLVGCQQAPLATIPSRQAETQKLTLGAVQSKIKSGISGDEVISVLGSPNIITTGKDNSETWVYDKVMTEKEVATGYMSGVAVTSSRTIIVTIKFGLDKRVKNVEYRQTSY